MGKILELDALAGRHISGVCEEAATLAQKRNKPVHFEFNGTHVTVQPGEVAATVEARWQTDFDAEAKAYRDSPEYAAAQGKREDDAQKAREAHLTESATDEKGMREAKVPWPHTKEQLTEYVESLVNRTHDYGTCVYAMSMAAEAAFNYVAHHLGVTGFQA